MTLIQTRHKVNPSKLTVRAINELLAKAGYKIALHQAIGFLYFHVSDAHAQEWLDRAHSGMDTYSVGGVGYLNHASLALWLQEAQAAHAQLWPSDPVPSFTVQLVPTQGGYQKPITGLLVRITEKHKVVRVERGLVTTDLRFDKTTGLPVGRTAKEFPRYRIA